jgi:hypothetical protein
MRKISFRYGLQASGSIVRPATVHEIHPTVVLVFTYNGASLEWHTVDEWWAKCNFKTIMHTHFGCVSRIKGLVELFGRSEYCGRWSGMMWWQLEKLSMAVTGRMRLFRLEARTLPKQHHHEVRISSQRR